MIIGIDLRCLENRINSGISVYTDNLIEKLFEIDQINQYKLFINRQNLKHLNKYNNYSNIKIYNYNIPNKLLNLTLKFLKFPKIDNLLKGVEIFWMPNINFFALSKKTGLIITAHDLSFNLMPELYSFKRRMWHWLVKPKNIYQRANKIIAVSENTKANLIKCFKLSPTKISVIYPGIKIDNYLNLISNQVDSKENIILTVATLEPRKNIETIILAFEKLLIDNPTIEKENWQLFIVGKKGWLNKKMFKIIKNSKFSKQIKIFNNLNREELSSIYQKAKIFIWPSYYEGFGFPPQEAKKFKLPIITSFHSSLVETLNDSTIYINPFNLNELTLAIKTIIKKNYIFKLTNDEKKYDWQNAAYNLLKVFELVYKENGNRN